MDLGTPAAWRDALTPYPTEALVRMLERLGLPLPMRRRKDGIVHALAAAHHEGRRPRELYAGCDRTAQLALRVALDGGDEGLAGDVVVAELKALGVRGVRAAIDALLERGLLLLNTELRPGWGSLAEALARPDQWRRWRLVAHPALRDDLQRLAVPGEPTDWARLAEPLPAGAAQPVHRAAPGAAIEALAAACAVIDRTPVPFTKVGELRAAVAKRFLRDGLFVADTLAFSGWLRLAEELGLVREDDRSDRWLREPGAHALRTDPLRVLAAVPSSLPAADPALVALVGAPWAATPSGLRFGLGYGYGFGGLGPTMTRVVVAQLRAGAARFLDDETWFLDRELLPVLHAHARRWVAQVRAGSADQWSWRSLDPQVVRVAAGAFVHHALDVLSVCGLLDRGVDSRRDDRASRLTRLGSWAFRTGAPDAPPAPRWPFAGDVRWARGARLVPADPGDAPLLGLALGALGRPSTDGPAAGFHVDEESLSEAVVAGAAVDEIEQRLRSLAADEPPPAAVADALDRAAGGYRPAMLLDELTAVDVPDLEPEERAALEAEGYTVVDAPHPLILVPPRRSGVVLRRFGIPMAATIDYDARPLTVCRVDPASGEVTIPRAKRRDLRLLGALEELGVPTPPAGRVTIAFDAVPGVADLDDAALEKHLAGLLRRLEAHVDGAVPDGLRLQLLADAGLVDAPAAAKALILTFPAAIARGLAERGALGPDAEPLPGGRFVVPAAAVADVEARLSALGVPFPAEHSSLRERAKARLAVDALQGAVAAIESESAAAGPAAAPVETAEPDVAPPPSPAADAPLADRVRAALARAGRDDRGLRLGEIEAETGAPRRAIKAALRRLMEDGAVRLEGHGRGARYRTT